jgi:hypothetical protein
MKKTFLITALLLCAGVTFGQSLQKGNLMALHTLEITPNPDVSFNEFMDHFTGEFIPKYEESFPGLHFYLLKGDRGESENKIGMLMFSESVDVRNMYWPSPDSASAEAMKGFEKMGTAWEDLQQYGTWSSVYTDWIIQ